MLRFDKLIRSSMTVREVKERYPHTSVVFENFGFRYICDDCSIDLVAQRQGLRPSQVVDALNWTIVPKEGYRE
jgi:hypothetical protein